MVGQHDEIWKIEGHRNKRTISVSGDASRTFFGHDLLISRNEHEQMTALAKILRAALSTVTGLQMSQNNIVLVDEVTIVRHFVVGNMETQREAIHKLYRNLVARFVGVVYLEGETIRSPGIVTVNFRATGEIIKIQSAADLINPSMWTSPDDEKNKPVFDAYNQHLRFEFTVGHKPLADCGLRSTMGWLFDLSTNDYIDRLFKSFGLSSHYRADVAGLPNDEKVTGHGADEANGLIDAWKQGEYVRGNNVRGSPFQKAKEFLNDAGFDIDILPEHHHWVSHGLHDLLQPKNSAKFSRELRDDVGIFDRWWEREETVTAIRDYGISTI